MISTRQNEILDESLENIVNETATDSLERRAGIAQWLQRRTRDRKEPNTKMVQKNPIAG